MIVWVIVCMVKVIMSETLVVIAKLNGNVSHNNITALNSTNSSGKNIVGSWLEPNKTNLNGSTMISISNEEFWKTFGPLLELSTNQNTDKFE